MRSSFAASKKISVIMSTLPCVQSAGIKNPGLYAPLDEPDKLPVGAFAKLQAQLCLHPVITACWTALQAFLDFSFAKMLHARSHDITVFFFDPPDFFTAWNVRCADILGQSYLREGRSNLQRHRALASGHIIPFASSISIHPASFFVKVFSANY